MPIPENLPRDIRPQRLPVEQLTKLARRVVFFPYDRVSTPGRHYKGDVRAALGHGLAVEIEREAQERAHNAELATLKAEIAALNARLENGAASSSDASPTGVSRVGDTAPYTSGSVRVTDSDERAGAPETTVDEHADAVERANEDATDDVTMPDGGITR